jgi:hypothetical protein
MRFVISTALLLALTSAGFCGDGGWRSLFNGKDLSGWRQTGEGSFVVESGTLKTTGGMGLLLYTKEKFGNSVIRVSFKRTHPKDDSGVFIRIPNRPADVWQAINQGYEVEIGDWPDDYSCTGVLYSLTKALARPEKMVGQWNSMEVTLDGPRTIVVVNGVRVTDYTEGQPVPPKQHNYEPDRGLRPNFGYIGLQNHAADSDVFFREISVRSLSSQGRGR